MRSLFAAEATLLFFFRGYEPSGIGRGRYRENAAEFSLGAPSNTGACRTIKAPLQFLCSPCPHHPE